MNEILEKRTCNSKTFYLGKAPGRRDKFAWDGLIGAIHYLDGQWNNIDNIFEPAVAPWNWQMLKAGYHIRVKNDFTAGQILEFEKQGETVQFQPMALEWTNDLDQIQSISMPQNVTPAITNPEIDLLPAVGMPSHQGTIRWNNAYGTGGHFEWQCTPSRLVKTLQIDSLANLPIPTSTIISGGNPVLRLNLIFDPSTGCDIYIDGTIWDKKTKKQSFNVIEFRKGSEVLWGFMPLRYWDSEGNEGQSIATLRKAGNNLYIEIRVPYNWLQDAIYPIFIDTIVDEQVGASSDDAWVYNPNGWNLTSTGQRFGRYSASYYSYQGPLRFTTVDIPQGATINVAYLTLKSSDIYSGTTCNAEIEGEAADNAATFSTRANYDGRVRTTASVPWSNVGAWANSTWYNTPSIISVIQEIVNRSGWVANNALVVFIGDWDNTSSDGAYRGFYSYDGSTTDAPKLHVEYTAGGGTTPKKNIWNDKKRKSRFHPNLSLN